MPKPCKECGSLKHSCFSCPSKPRSPLKTTSTLKATKPLQKIGKVGKKTQAAMAQWKRKQKPNHEGYFICVYCERWKTYTRAEHTDSRARHPESRTDQSKFDEACDECNERKGSMSAEEFIELLKKEATHE
jgi:5-methylcytosine-specific restriction endonuclease McrA